MKSRSQNENQNQNPLVVRSLGFPDRHHVLHLADRSPGIEGQNPVRSDLNKLDHGCESLRRLVTTFIRNVVA